METNTEKRLLQIVSDYFICKNEFRLLTISSGFLDYDSPFYRYYRDVERTFQKLDKDEQLIIRNEYFFHHKPGWWKALFDNSSFRRIKQRAVSKFVRFFYEIH